jgi:hypothetical protein
MAYSKIEKNELFIDICSEITKGKSLRNILKEEGMPSTATFFVWLSEDEEKLKQYTRACDIRAEVIFDEMLEIADDGTNDFVKKQTNEGLDVEVLNTEHVQRSRLRIDTRKWLLSKLNPKKYSDRLQTDTNLSGEVSIVWKEEKSYDL